MKNIKLILFLLILVIVPINYVKAEEIEEMQYYVYNGTAFLYNEPNVESEHTEIKEKTTLYSKEYNDDWAKVEYDGKIGYINVNAVQTATYYDYYIVKVINKDALAYDDLATLNEDLFLKERVPSDTVTVANKTFVKVLYIANYSSYIKYEDDYYWVVNTSNFTYVKDEGCYSSNEALKAYESYLMNGKAVDISANSPFQKLGTVSNDDKELLFIYYRGSYLFVENSENIIPVDMCIKSPDFIDLDDLQEDIEDEDDSDLDDEKIRGNSSMVEMPVMEIIKNFVAVAILYFCVMFFIIRARKRDELRAEKEVQENKKIKSKAESNNLNNNDLI